MYEPLTLGHQANLTAAISIKCSSEETSAWSWNQSIIQAARRDPATPPASWPLPLGHHCACERLRRSRSRLPIVGRALRLVERGGEVFSATQAPCKPSRENGSIAVRADVRTEL